MDPLSERLEAQRPAKEARAMIGRAVYASQNLEVILTVCNEAVEMLSNEEYLEKTQGFIDPKRFKEPLKNVLKRLDTRNSIASDFLERVSNLLEKRHLVIHRWGLLNGFADDTETDYWITYGTVAEEVAVEADEITHLLAGYMVKWADIEWATANPAEYRRKMSRLFHEVGMPHGT